MPQGGHPTPSFDHLVGEREQRLRHGEAECIDCLLVDGQLKFDRLLDWGSASFVMQKCTYPTA